VRWLNDPEVNRWLAIPASGPPASLEDEHRWFERTAKDTSQLVWSIETKDGRLLGNIALHLALGGMRADSAEFGLFIGEKGEWGQGYGSDAVQALLSYAFDQAGLRRVCLHSDVENHRAHRAFKKCGFREEGLVKEYRRRWGDARFVDGVLMAVLAHEFKSRP
jgi:RimJ/RimL family protein N-acetyltransferase